ncbi:energy transducer TonB [Glaciecola siphonariae]|uniref:Energy transducer TonB n=1 Tax=Glaciecola siphonariae TaxID=521012 RepID=A0ABV9LWR2_9ALTE
MYRMILFITIFALSACQTTEAPQSSIEKETGEVPKQYIDLTSPNPTHAILDYWQIKTRVDPRYPSTAARDKLSGCVETIVGIGTDGRAAELAIRFSYPQGVFDSSAVKALKEWRWTPANTNQERHPVLAVVKLYFSVANSKNKKAVETYCGDSGL